MFPFLLNVRHFGAIHLVRTQNFRKKNIYAMPCLYQAVKNVSFSENFPHVLN